jgi:hypothetical protein
MKRAELFLIAAEDKKSLILGRERNKAKALS